MRKLYSLLMVLILCQEINAQIINFSDPNFKAKLLESSTTNSIAQNLIGTVNIKIDSNNNSEIEVSEVLNVQRLNVQNSNLSSLEGINYFENLVKLDCSNNQLISIDISSLLHLDKLNLDFNSNLQFANFKNGRIVYFMLPPPPAPPGDEGISFFGCNNLSYICLDDQFIDELESYLNTFSFSNEINYNSYCSFTPGGIFYSVQGNTRFDFDANGCGINDLSTSGIKFNVTNGTNSGTVIATTENYFIPVSAGTYTVTPVIDNPSVFSISPNSITVTFPTQTSPFIQDFCITSNSTISNDLEVTLFPLNTARPGFDAIYKIKYQNKGNQTLSGIVNLDFDDSVLDYVNSNPATSSQILNVLEWSFTNLQPFETRQIELTLNVNSPTETPPVSGGDVLNYFASISNQSDVTPENNTSAIKQDVFNSFDPNDKSCLEGSIVSADVIGEYVHYKIRFENTGTFEAENIVVKDLIDEAKFDVTTLTPISGSHSFSTRIVQNNKVEFVFENINLPFDDANNDGYVIFKIKTKPNLVVGDSFSNSASIYFDYNFPIDTNTATTTIQALANSDFEFGNYFTIAPNPVNDFLIIKKKVDIDLSSLSVYNALGQLIMTVLEPNSDIDVSELKSGNYFIKVISDEGTSSINFIKK
ncbi:MAG: T9SS type A sorting domain-containing protein [Flavobacteriales bacterium]|nr:T9SS type A sorting domain-containing protein [Flavobacteriales bacterium]